MRILNVVIICVLILAVVYIFHLSNFNKIHIRELEKELVESRAIVDSLKKVNEIIKEDVFILEDSIAGYKTTISFYGDSLFKIQKHYETINSKVYALDDSSSVIYFKQYLSRYNQSRNPD